MAEVGQSYGENEVEQVQEHVDLEQNLNLGHDLNLEHSANLDQNANLEHIANLEHMANLEHNANLEHIANLQQIANLEHNANLEHIANLEHNANLEHSVDSEQNLNLEEEPEENLEEQKLQQESQHQPKQDHENEAVVGGGEKKWPGWPGESVFRMLVPAQKVGSIIGRKGEFIKKIVEETRARIKILDGPPGTTERAVMVSGKEEPDSSLPPAMDGLLRVHKRLIDGLEGDSSHAPSAVGTKVSTRLLVPAPQAGSLIGKQGTTVKTIQESSNCIVRVLGSEDLPVFALQDDRIVEVVGEAADVHKALELIASHLRKFLVDRSIIPLFEMHMQKSNPQMDHMPPRQTWAPPQGVPPNAGGGGFGHNPQYMPPPRQLENYYPPADMPPMDKQPHQGISAYGREAPTGAHGSSNPNAPSMITQRSMYATSCIGLPFSGFVSGCWSVFGCYFTDCFTWCRHGKVTQQMQIPLSYADAVIGTAGASISYIRRVSGATVTIQETRGVPGEMTVEISGTASQVQTAQQLIQACSFPWLLNLLDLSFAICYSESNFHVFFIAYSFDILCNMAVSPCMPCSHIESCQNIFRLGTYWGEFIKLKTMGTAHRIVWSFGLICWILLVLQNFMAEAAAPAQAQVGGAADQAYNPYAAHGSLYASPPSNPGHAGGYGYGSNYGF
ncbi:hypothetical protein Golob_018205 [Gossypium lobatum]|uniref:K Homology domain-containing protein n=1 Tax=Gossypium lobatum TaxID=34289 RepID=A0A7J8M9H8_9ROSI|nr:hypothetical protein [Gossypium lobatum]